jgi:two-component system chemotaxis response regulator CheB
MDEGSAVRIEANHDLIAVGASAGGLEFLQMLVRDLPTGLPATVLIVQHVGSRSYLAEILGRQSGLPVLPAQSGEPLQRSHVYVGVPGMHLLVHDGHLLLRRGPRENLSRPAIDPLFRSAACSYGARVIGVVLSGALNDGTAGLRAIKRCGGLAVVQDPTEAPFPDMPASALSHVDVDYCVAGSELAPLLTRLVAEPAGLTPDIPLEIRIKAGIAALELAGMATEEQLGTKSPFTCPECNGSLWAINDGEFIRYRCHMGHAYTGEAMLEAQSDDIERLLWDVMRTHRDRANLARRLAQRERSNEMAARMAQRAQEYEEDAKIMEKLIYRSGFGGQPENDGGDHG